MFVWRFIGIRCIAVKLTLADEYTRESLAIKVDRTLKAYDLIEQLAELFVQQGTPDYLRSDNGSEFAEDVVRGWLARLDVKTLFIEPGTPWENGS